MAKALREYFPKCLFTDIVDYGWEGMNCTQDFLGGLTDQWPVEYDWIITNPPFNQAEEFILAALRRSVEGVAIFSRLSFLETKGRYERLFSQHPPSVIAVFSERVPIFRGRVDSKGSTAASYCWLIWIHDSLPGTRVMWIPPCRKALEQEDDYDNTTAPEGPSD